MVGGSLTGGGAGSGAVVVGGGGAGTGTLAVDGTVTVGVGAGTDTVGVVGAGTGGTVTVGTVTLTVGTVGTCALPVWASTCAAAKPLRATIRPSSLRNHVTGRRPPIETSATTTH